eukprot:5933925-Heterocapsa_arctica.AAC.1
MKYNMTRLTMKKAERTITSQTSLDNMLVNTNHTDACGEGTRHITRNVSGSQCDFEHVLDMTEDHTILIQEHWILEEDIETWKTIAFNKGWHGGVAVLVWKGRTIMKSSMEAYHRLVGAIIGLAILKSTHIMSIYGHATGHNNHEEGNPVLRGRVGRQLAAIGR